MKKLVIEVPDDCAVITFTFIQDSRDGNNVTIHASSIKGFDNKVLVLNKDYKVCYFKDKRSK